VARQNLSSNDAIFAAAEIDIIMQPGRLVGQRVVDLLTTPLLSDFLRLARRENETWANVLVSRVAGILTDRPPESWILTLSREQSPAVLELLDEGASVLLSGLLTDPRDVAARLPCVPLYIKHLDQQELLMPEDDTALQPGDQILFCGQPTAETHMRWNVHNSHALNYICSGYDRPSGSIWRWLSERRTRKANA
jgi:hypothetical protein